MKYLLLSFVIFGCSSAGPRTLKVSKVPCIKKTKTTPEDIVVITEIHGPKACEKALTTFMETHPETRIAGIAPILTPSIHVGLKDGIYVEEGTQHLLVTHTDEKGPWPQAKELRVGLTPLCEKAGQKEWRGKWCQSALEEVDIWLPANAMLVPIVYKQIGMPLETTKIMQIRYRDHPNLQLLLGQSSDSD